MAIVAAGIITALILVLVEIAPVAMDTLFGGLLYGIAQLLFKLCDFLQLIFRKLAGLDEYWYYESGDSPDAESGDILISLFTNKVVIEALIAMVMFAVALLLIITIVQIIRVEYTTEGSKNSKGTIIGKALKSLVMFILVPVICFLGIFVSNKLLFAVDAATAQSGASTVSGYIFLAGAADANVIRTGKADKIYLSGLSTSSAADAKATLNEEGKLENWTNSTILSSTKATEEGRRNDLANKIDNLFVCNYNWLDTDNAASNTAITVSKAMGGGDTGAGKLKKLESDTIIHYSQKDAVEYFYNLTDMNYFIFYFGAGSILLSFLKASMGLIMRLYKATALFIISPGVIALGPIDGDAAYKSWRKSFLSQVLGAYGYVIAMNLLFLLLGIIDNIYLFNPNGNVVYVTANYLVQALMVIVGVNLLTDLAGQISGFVGGEDILKSGTDMAGKATKSIGKIGSTVGGGIMVAKGIAGGIASKISSFAANHTKDSTKALDRFDKKTGYDSKEHDRLKQMNPDDMSKDEKKQLEKFDKLESRRSYHTKEGKAERWRQRAAAGAKANLRGKETAQNMWEGSAVASFLNNATGGYISAFGGKTLDNLDKKLIDKNEDVYSIAGQHSSLNNLKSRVRAFGYKQEGVIGKIDEGATKAHEFIKENTRDATARFRETQKSYEQNKANHDMLNATLSDKEVSANYMKKSNGSNFSDEEISAIDKRDENIKRTELLQKDITSTLENDKFDDNLIEKLKQVKEGDFLQSQSKTKLSNLIKELQKDNLSADRKQEVLRNFEVGELKANKLDSVFDGLTKEDQTRLAGAHAMQNYRDNFDKKGFSATNDTIKKLLAVDALNQARAAAAAEDDDFGAPTGGGKGKKKKKVKNVNITGGNVKMDNTKAEINSSDTKLNDKNKLADAMSKSITQGFKNAKEKSEKEKKDTEVMTMLSSIQKILKNVEKNTKKK